MDSKLEEIEQQISSHRLNDQRSNINYINSQYNNHGRLNSYHSYSDLGSQTGQYNGPRMLHEYQSYDNLKQYAKPFTGLPSNPNGQINSHIDDNSDRVQGMKTISIPNVEYPTLYKGPILTEEVDNYNTPRTTRDIPNRDDEHSPLRGVSVIFRHGARLPINDPIPTGQTPSPWPSDHRFYTNYPGHLTPLGHNQCQTLGSQLARRYETFLSDATIKGYCSAKERSVFSMWGVMDGIKMTISSLKDTIVGWRYPGTDPIPDHWIPIIMAKKGNDPLYHNGKRNSNYRSVREIFEKKSDVIREINRTNKYDYLIRRLHTVTRDKHLRPVTSPTIEQTIKALHAISSIGSLIDVHRAHKIPVFPDMNGTDMLVLTPEELRDIAEIRVLIMEGRYYVPDNIEAPFEELSDWNTAMMSSEITQELISFDNTFTLYSGHDITLISLMAGMGIKLKEIPKFCDYIAIERWGDNKIVFRYGGINTPMNSRYWKPQLTYQHLKSLPEGSFTIEEWSKLVLRNEYIAARDCIFSHIDYPYSKIDIRYLNYFDVDGDGYLSESDILIYSSYYIKPQNAREIYLSLIEIIGKHILLEKNTVDRGVSLLQLVRILPIIKWSTL